MTKDAMFQAVGVVLMVSSIWLYSARKDSDFNKIKAFGVELSLSTPSLFFLLAGLTLFIFPFTQFYKDQVASSPRGQTPVDTKVPTSPETGNNIDEASPMTRQTVENHVRQNEGLDKSQKSDREPKPTLHFVACAFDKGERNKLFAIAKDGFPGDVIWNDIDKARYKVSTITYFHSDDKHFASDLALSFGAANVPVEVEDASRREEGINRHYLDIWMISPDCKYDIQYGS